MVASPQCRLWLRCEDGLTEVGRPGGSSCRSGTLVPTGNRTTKFPERCRPIERSGRLELCHEAASLEKRLQPKFAERKANHDGSPKTPDNSWSYRGHRWYRG